MSDLKKILNKNTTVLFATFSPWINGKRLPTNGSLDPLRDFFVPKVKKLVLIDQVYPGSDFVMPRIEVYEKNQKPKILSSSWWLYFLYPLLVLTNKQGTHITFKLRDFFSVIDCCLRDKTRYDFFIGLECINALAGIILRKIGLIKKVIYYVSDYSPHRYPQKWFNWLYLQLDKHCAMHSDYIWDVSKAMQKARIEESGLDPKKSAPALYVPNALYPTQVKTGSLDKIRPYTLVYMGTLGRENGPGLVIEAMPKVLKKFPKTTFCLIGGGKSNLQRLRNKVAKLKLKGKVRFYGFVLDREEMSRIMRNCYLALAPYRAIPGSPRYYADAGKIRHYAGSGLPIITTDIPPLGKEAVEKGAAIMVKDNSQALAEAIIKVFSNRKLYLRLRRGAIKFAKGNTWENEFTSAFKRMKN